MARIHGLLKGINLSGSAGELTFFTRNGITYVRKRKSKGYKRPATSQNRAFGLASVLSKDVRALIDSHYSEWKEKDTHSSFCKVFYDSIKATGHPVGIFNPLQPLNVEDIAVKKDRIVFLSPKYWNLDRDTGNFQLNVTRQLIRNHFEHIPKPFELLLKVITLSEVNVGKYTHPPLHPSWHPRLFKCNLNVTTFLPRTEVVEAQIELVHDQQTIPPEVGLIVTLGLR